MTPSQGRRTPGAAGTARSAQVVSSTSPAAAGRAVGWPVKFAATTREPTRYTHWPSAAIRFSNSAIPPPSSARLSSSRRRHSRSAERGSSRWPATVLAG